MATSLSASTGPDFEGPDGQALDRLRAAAEWIRRSGSEAAQIPTVVRSERVPARLQEDLPGTTLGSTEFMGRHYLWGRIPAPELLDFYLARGHLDASSEVADLALPFVGHGPVQGNSRRLESLLAKTDAEGDPEVIVAVIDLGVGRKGATPNDFSGKIEHVVTQDVELDRHAERVLETILSRIDQKRDALPRIRVVCALVASPPEKAIGLSCFEHEGSVEFADALEALRRHLSRYEKVPTVINISLGTHGGPHNGCSPIEEVCGKIANEGTTRVLLASAGNEGNRSLHAQRDACPYPGIFELTTVRGCNDLLIELWWEEDLGSPASIKAIVEQQGQQMFQGFSLSAPQRRLTLLDTGQGPVVRSALCASRCYDPMSCAALLLHADDGDDLADLRVLLRLDAKSRCIVHGWITYCRDPAAGWIQADQGGTVSIPATHRDMGGGGAYDEKPDTPWYPSGKGPIPDYDSAPPGHDAPLVAHVAQAEPNSLDKGTSFACAHATANVVTELLAGKRFSGARQFVTGLVQRPHQWHNTMGFGAIPL